jgi:hypothetical protein
MIRNLSARLALAFACLLIAGRVGASPFNSYPPAPPPNGSAVGLIWQGGPTVVTANNAWMRANLGVAQVRTLESFAVALGVTLGGVNDQPVFDAANAAIIAAKHSGGLAVSLPVGMTVRATHLLLDNNGGYFCPAPGQCKVQDAYAGPYAAPTYLVEINDPQATNIVLAGINFDGGWTYGAGAYASAPSSDPALDMRGGVNLVSAFNGAGDPLYVANSDIASQEPRKTIQDLVIARFAGDCFTETGAGSNTTHNVRTQRCGGYGMNLDTYDSNFSDLDLGESGRGGLYCHDNCAANRFSAVKIWYAGFRQITGATAGLDEEGATGNQFIGLEVQDDAGDCVRLDNVDLTRIVGSCQWQGAINALPPTVCALHGLGMIDSQIDLIVSLIDHAGQTYSTVNKLICDERSQRDTANTSYAHHNDVRIDTEGFPQDFNGFSQSWINGPFDTSNGLTINGVTRQPSAWAADPATGQVNFGATMNGTLAGMIAFGPASPYAGSLSFIAPGGTMAFQGETTTGAYAAATLTSTQNYADGETLQVGAVVYTMKAALTGAPNEIHIGATEAATLANITNAINAADSAYIAGTISGNTLTVAQLLNGAIHIGDTIAGPGITTATVTAGSGSAWTLSGAAQTVSFTNQITASSGVIGVDYGYGTTPSFQVGAGNNGAHAVTVTALALGVAANAIPIATTAAHAAWSGATLTGGAADTQSYNAGLTIDQYGNLVSPKMQLQGHFTSDAAYCASPHAVNGGLYTDTSSGRAQVFQAAC